jgi:DNA-binding beta-propeller fold protein YncE
MANTRIQIKSSGTASNVPSPGALANGELALNYADEKLYFKNSGGTVKSFSTTGGGGPGGLTTEVQFNDSGSLGGNASFTFDKTTSTVTVGLPSSSANTIIQPSLMASGRFIKSPYPIAAPTPIINKGNGSLSNNDVLIVSGSPATLTIDATGRFVYVAPSSGGSAIIRLYSIDQNNGTLSNIGILATGSSDGNGYITSDPTGRFVYITNIADGNILQYTIQQSNGALTSIGTTGAGSEVSGGIAVDPTGRFVYQLIQEAFGNSYINHFSINQTTGALTGIGSISAGYAPTSLFIEPTGRFLYVTDFNVLIYLIIIKFNYIRFFLILYKLINFN